MSVERFSKFLFVIQRCAVVVWDTTTRLASDFDLFSPFGNQFLQIRQHLLSRVGAGMAFSALSDHLILQNQSDVFPEEHVDCLGVLWQ